jgi:FkbM family methyltransferase
VEDIAYFAFWGLQGAKIRAEGYEIYPPGRYTWGEDIVRAHMEHFRADACITLWDIWVVNEEYAEQAYPWIPWTPIDMYPPPPLVVERAKQAYQVLVYSKFAQDAMREQGVETVYIPHGVDASVYMPLDKLECRRRLGFPEDAFVIGMVAANKGQDPCRKAIPEALLAFQEFRLRHSDAVMYLHMDLEGHDGVDVRAIIRSLGLPKGSVQAVDQYRNVIGLPPEYLADAYNAMNVLHAASMSEGFGLPILEAQACGTRVVTTNWTSMPELTFDGICTEPAQRYWTNLGSWAVMPSVANIVDAWERIYRGELGDPMSHSLIARCKAEEYDWEKVVQDYWRPFLEGLEWRLKVERAAGIGPRGRRISGSCAPGAHRWAKTGLFYGDVLCIPCLYKDCPAELAILPDGRRVYRKTGFAMETDGIALDIEDDPDGGVAKIVYREIETSYGINTIAFEPGDVVLDLGAHVGVVSIYIAKRWPEVTVIAVEPVPENYGKLCHNIVVNCVGNVVPVDAAVTGDGRDVMLYGDLGTNSGGASVFVRPSSGGYETVARSFTLAELFEFYVPNRCKLLKVDIEGTEYEVLRADPTLLDRVDYLVVEAHTGDALSALGYEAEKLREMCTEHVDQEHLFWTASKIA